MKILTFDTCLNKTYVTLSANGKVLSSKIVENHNEKYHSAFLIPTIVSILKDSSMVLQDLNAIGTNVGPGSFTGIRACVTVARVFAQQLDVPLIGISSLEILSKLNKTEKNTIVILDARKNQYYTALYDKEGNELQAPKLTAESDVLALNLADSFVISDESSNNFLSGNGLDSVIYTDSSDDLGLYLNKLVCDKAKASDKESHLWAKLKPLYLQTPPVSIRSKA